MEITTKGVAYPSSSDNIAPLETHFAALAQSADKVGVLSASQQFTGPAATGSTSTVVVSFGKTLSSPAKVVCTVEGVSASSFYSAMVVGPTLATGFTARVYRLNGSGADSNLKLVWYASDYSA